MLTKQEEYIQDWNSACGTQFYAAGIAEGKAEERRELAQAMLQQGLSPEMIARITGLEIPEINPSSLAKLTKAPIVPTE